MNTCQNARPGGAELEPTTRTDQRNLVLDAATTVPAGKQCTLRRRRAGACGAGLLARGNIDLDNE